MASEKQVKYIHVLAKKAGVKVNPDELKRMSSVEASRYIDRLKNKTPGKKGAIAKPGFNPITLGLASKLVNERWIANKNNPLRYPTDFIQEVEKTYDLLKKTETALNTA